MQNQNIRIVHKLGARFRKYIRHAFYPTWRRWLQNKSIFIAKDSHVEFGAILDTRKGGSITIGSGTEILSKALVASYGGKISIGNNSSINPLAVIYGHGNVTIGNNVLIATQVTIIPANHVWEKKEELISTQGLTTRGITIEDDVWIGSGAKILDGVTISKGCIIGANAVVTRSTERYTLYVGIPARKCRERK